jgi:hypothetical protein
MSMVSGGRRPIYISEKVDRPFDFHEYDCKSTKKDIEPLELTKPFAGYSPLTRDSAIKNPALLRGFFKASLFVEDTGAEPVTFP